MVEHAKTQLYKATKDYRFLSFIGNGVVLHEYISIIMWRNVEKNTFWHVRPMQTRISLSIRAVWSESFARIENPIPLGPSPPTHTPSWISKMRQEKIQVWLPECTSWSESALLSDWTFSDIAAKIVLCIFLLFEQSFVIFSSPCSPPSPPPPPPPPHPRSFFSFPRRFLCCSSVFVHRWFHIWRLCCPYLFLIFSYFGASGGLCFVIVAFPGYFFLNLSLRKHAYSNILRILPPKNDNLQMKNLFVFIFLLKT